MSEQPRTEDTDAFKVGFHRGVRVGFLRGKSQAAARPLHVEAWAREIVLHDDQHHDTDHACAECIPDGESVVPGFRCVPHEARAYLASLSQPGGSDG